MSFIALEVGLDLKADDVLVVDFRGGEVLRFLDKKIDFGLFAR